MWEDPIVADVHRTREQLAAKFGFDVKSILADLRARQEGLAGRLVRKQNRPTDAPAHGPRLTTTEEGGE
jgi:hypothetical protein